MICHSMKYVYEKYHRGYAAVTRGFLSERHRMENIPTSCNSLMIVVFWSRL